MLRINTGDNPATLRRNRMSARYDRCLSVCPDCCRLGKSRGPSHPAQGCPDTNAARPQSKLALSPEFEVAQASPCQISSSPPLESQTQLIEGRCRSSTTVRG